MAPSPQFLSAGLLAELLQLCEPLPIFPNSRMPYIQQQKLPHGSSGESCVSEVVHRDGSRGGSSDRQPVAGTKGRLIDTQRAELADPVGYAWTPDFSLHALYSLGPQLGAGQFGVVRACLEMSTGALWACKSVRRPSAIRKAPSSGPLLLDPDVEIFALQSVAAHPHVIHLHSVHRNTTDVYLVMDLCAGGDMLDFTLTRRRLSETQAACVTAQLASALSHCSRVGVMHRDVKLENILIAGMLPGPVAGEGPNELLPFVQLADFGLSTRLRPGEKTSGRAGSTQYMSPEMSMCEPYSANSDVWSLGICLYIMLSGFHPFSVVNHHSQSETAIRQHFHTLDLASYSWPSISQSAKDLVRRMLDPNPGTRASIEDVLDHPWLLKSFPQLRTPPSPFPPPSSRTTRTPLQFLPQIPSLPDSKRRKMSLLSSHS